VRGGLAGICASQPVSETENYSAVTVTGSVTDLVDSEDIVLITRFSQSHSDPSLVAVSVNSSGDKFNSIVTGSPVTPVASLTSSLSNPEHWFKAAGRYVPGLTHSWKRTARSFLPTLCGSDLVAVGIATKSLFLCGPSRGHALWVAASNARREPLEGLIFGAILAAADQDMRAALLVPAISGAGGHVTGEL